MLAGVYKTFSKVDTLLKTQYGAALDNFEGNIHFWRSDMTIHRRTGFYSSVRMASNRVVGAESWFFFDDAIICLGAGIKNQPEQNSRNYGESKFSERRSSDFTKREIFSFEYGHA